MMQRGDFDQISQKSLEMKDNESKFSTKAISKEANSAASSSFRVYYGGGAGAIPFTWESRPGTPKHTFSQTSLPPLTPPPSYHSSSFSTSKSPSKQTLLTSIFPRLTPRKSRASSSFSFSSSSSLASWSSSRSSSTSSLSSFVRPKFFKARLRSLDSPSWPYEYNTDGNNADELVGRSNSPTSTLCFGGSSNRASFFGGCYQFVSVKNALLSTLGHGSSRGGTTVN